MPVNIDDSKAVLNAAADLLSDPGKWGQGQYAQDAKGRALSMEKGEWIYCTNGDCGVVTKSEPVCFCVIGAMMEVSKSSSTTVEKSAAATALSSTVEKNVFRIPDWNDNMDTHRIDVVNALREAANSCQ